MAWTLINAIQNEQDPYRQGILQTFWMESNLMAAVVFETINRLRMELRRVGRLSLTKSSWVGIDASYTAATVDIEALEEQVFKLGRDIDIPRDLADLDGQFEDPRVLNAEANLKAMAYEFNEAVVNGPNVGGSTGTNNPFAPIGIRNRVLQIAQLAGLSAAIQHTAAAGTAFGPSASSANRNTVWDSINKSVYFVREKRPDFGVCNDSLMLAMESAARREAWFSNERDQYERWISTFRGIPIYDAGLKVDQVTKIITDTELCQNGATSTSTSLFWVKNGVATDFMCFEKSPGLDTRDLGELQTGPTLRTRIDWLLGFGNWHPRSLAQVASIQATT